MPWNPVKKFPGVMGRVRQWGYEKEVPISEIRKALIIETGSVRPETLRRYLKIMEELGYIEIRNERVAIIKDTNGGMGYD